MNSRLSHYEHYQDKSKSFGDKLFFFILVFVVTGLIALGIYFKGIKPILVKRANLRKIETSFLFNQKKKIVPPKEIPKPKKEEVKKKPPLDLTKKVEITKKEEEIVKPKPVVAKRVFGLKKVYSSGLGSGGSMSDAVVNKQGNTVNKEYDDVKATKNDLKGAVVSLAKVTRQPELDQTTLIKPEYTQEMKENGIEGLIKAKILIDVDGKVKDVKLLNDLGFGSGKQVIESCYKLKFKPALEEGEPRAVWIILRFNLSLRT